MTDEGPDRRGDPSQTIEISGSETGVVRVFATPRAATALRDPAALRAELGIDAEGVNTDNIDVVDIADLHAMALSTYLRQAHGVAENAPGLADLDTRRGTVLIVPSRMFAGRPSVMRPATGVRLLARLTEEAAEPASLAPLHSDGAEGLIPGAPTADLSRQNRRASGYVAMAALAVAFGIALVMWLVAR
jgi:hypothetical protein